jgi:hypothetical protein
MISRSGWALALSYLAVAPALRVGASDQVVSDAGDSGAGNQLRAKIVAAQTTGGGKITFSTGLATVVLTSTLPPITNNVTIDGGGLVAISGNNAYTILTVNSGATLTLSNLTLTRAFASGDGGAVRNSGTLHVVSCKFSLNQVTGGYSGGAILTYGVLNVTNTEFASNSGANGGALYPRFSPAVTTIVGCSFHDNTANDPVNGWGGALLLWDGAPVSVYQSLFSNNVARQHGGVAFVEGPSVLNLNKSQLVANTAAAGDGGGIYNQGTLTVAGCIFTSNQASNPAIYLGGGGAISHNSGSASIYRSSFFGNWAQFNGGACVQQPGSVLNMSDCTFGLNGYKDVGDVNYNWTFYGGAFANLGGQATVSRLTALTNSARGGGGLYLKGTNYLQNMTLSANSANPGGGISIGGGFTSLTNVTIYGNSAPLYGGGIHVDAGVCLLKNTLLAGNSGGNVFPILGGSFCLSDDSSTAFGSGRDNVPTILLGPLANNGGTTLTFLPQPGSAAIDNGTAAGAPLLDQRGFMRAGAATDVGAVESSGRPMLITSITPTNGSQMLLLGNGLPNSPLSVEGSLDLDANNFGTVGSTASDAFGNWQLIAPSPGTAHRYYRASYPY